MSAHRGIKTLKDIFPEIKKDYKRNFLLENKIKIKDIQKDVRTRKQIEEQKQEETEKRKQKLQERLARNTTRTNSASISNLSSIRRSKSNYSHSPKCNECACGAKLISPPVSAKSTTSIDKEVQTDYDLEETYRNCKFIESSKDIHLPLQITDEEERYLKLQRNSNSVENIIDKEKRIEQHEEAESNINRMTNGRDQRLESLANPFYRENIDFLNPHHEIPKSAALNDKVNQLKLDDEVSIITSDVGKKKSARSIISNSSSRSDIKLPKYLEREKREKELQRIREMERDPDCPDGFALLDEKIRLENLEVLQKGFQSLIDELNRLPMTSVTLRVKNRKNEIERDLVDLENKIRFYQKPKIYIKCSTTST